MRGKSLMVMGTASSVGKSVLCSAFLRIMKQDGYKVAPFKAQNMALNSFVTKDGLEMGRAQVTQAQAAGVEPDVRMNPVLLKPTSDRRSQVIVGGKAIGTMTAMEYHRYKPALRERIKATYDALESTVDCVVIEGAGSPAEINLRAGDIVNMSMAESADAPVLLVGDINLGGVFASLLGTVMLLTDEERARVKGVIINKFRGDVKILEPGLKMLEERIHIPVLGVVPWMDVGLEDEDSVTERFSRMMGQGDLDVAVVKLKHISNFTDFQSLALQPGVKVRYAQTSKEVENADLIVLPGTKNTIEDLIDLRNRGLDAAIIRHARKGGMVIGVCGGYQMLGRKLHDPDHVESRVPELAGLDLLDMEVTFAREKETAQASGVVDASGWLASSNGILVDGYEIHAGQNQFGEKALPWLRIGNRVDGVMNERGNVLGSYLHGLFDDGQLFAAIAAHIRKEKGIDTETQAPMTLDEYREQRDLPRVAVARDNGVGHEGVEAHAGGQCERRYGRHLPYCTGRGVSNERLDLGADNRLRAGFAAGRPVVAVSPGVHHRQIHQLDGKEAAAAWRQSAEKRRVPDRLHRTADSGGRRADFDALRAAGAHSPADCHGSAGLDGHCHHEYGEGSARRGKSAGAGRCRWADTGGADCRARHTGLKRGRNHQSNRRNSVGEHDGRRNFSSAVRCHRRANPPVGIQSRQHAGFDGWILGRKIPRHWLVERKVR